MDSVNANDMWGVVERDGESERERESEREQENAIEDEKSGHRNKWIRYEGSESMRSEIDVSAWR